MDNDLQSVFSDEQQPAAEAPAEQPEHAEQETQVETGEQQATPAESEADKRAKGIEAALLAERRKRQELEAHIQRLSQPKQEQAKPEGPPDPNNYQDNPQEYWRLLARFEARQEVEQARAREAEERKAEAQRQEMMQRAERINSAIVKGQAKYQDFDAVINGGLGPFLNPVFHAAITESDVAEDVSYWLGRNPAEAARISQLSERQMLREIAKLEARVSVPEERQTIPRTLTNQRDARGRFEPAYAGPTPLDDILARKT